MKLEFLIATMNQKDVSFLSAMFQHIGLEHVNAIVINQLTEIDVPRNLQPPHPGIRVFSVNETGLSKSRNMALKYSTGDILIIADDDVVYAQNALEVIQQYHMDYPHESVLTFQAIGVVKKYCTSTRLHNFRSALRVSSCEITLKRDSGAKGLLFDERFGLGATYPIGEDNIWLMDALRRGAKARFIPEKTVAHQGISTGTRYSAVDEKARGAAFIRMCGALAIPLFFWFALKKYPAFKKKHSMIREIYYLFQGGVHFLLSSLRNR